MVALAEVASRSGASDMATWSMSRAFAGSGSNSSLGVFGSVYHTDDSAPRADGTQRNVALACRGTRASTSTATTTEMPAAGHSSRSCDTSAGSTSADSSSTTRIHGQRWSARSSVPVRVRATATSWRTSSAAASGVAVTWEPATGDVAERVCGSHLAHVPSPGVTPSITAMTRSSGLCSVAAWISTDEHIAADVGWCAVEAEHAELARLTQIGTAGSWSDPASGGVHVVAQLVVAGRLPLDLDPRAHRPEAEPDPQELVVAALARPQVEGAQRRPAGEVGEVGRLVDALGALVDQGRSISARRLAMRPWSSATWASYRRRPVFRPPSWLKTTIAGDRAIVISMYGLLVKANRARPMTIGATIGRHRHPRLLRPRRDPAERAERPIWTTTGLYGVRRNGTWPS